MPFLIYRDKIIKKFIIRAQVKVSGVPSNVIIAVKGKGN